MSKLKEIRVRRVSVHLDKKRNLKFDLNAFAELEELYGSVDGAMEALEKGSIKALRAVLWAGLIHEELDEGGVPKITPQQVGSMVDISSLETLTDKINEAMQADLGEPVQPVQPGTESEGAEPPLEVQSLR